MFFFLYENFALSRKSVIFDLDGTLLDRDTSVEQFVLVQYDRLTEHLSHIPTDRAPAFVSPQSDRLSLTAPEI